MLTPDGVEYRVIHARNSIPRPDSFPAIAEKGGKTIVHIVGPEQEGGGREVLATGKAFCRPDENYNRRLGRTIALGRALESLRDTGEPDVPSDAELRGLAQGQYGSDEIEIDSNAVVSRGEDRGAFVAAWVWVAFPEDDPGG